MKHYRNLILALVATFLLGCSTKLKSIQDDTFVLIRSADDEVVVAYDELTNQQKERVDRALELLLQKPEDRPTASTELRYHPVSKTAESLQANSQPAEIDIDCVYDETENDEGDKAGALGCWIGDSFCGVVWGASIEVGCW